MTLDELEVIEAHIRQLDEELARLLRVHPEAVERLAAVPGLGPNLMVILNWAEELKQRVPGK